MMNLSRRFLVLVVAGLCIAGCDNLSNFGPVGAVDARTSKVASNGQHLQPGDKIKITVYGEDKISGDYDIDPDGFVTLPLAGTLQAAGLTKSELRQTLSKKFSSEYLRNPKVTVDISTFRPFYVLGEVERPGEYPYRSGLNVMSAMAIAGGDTFRASHSYVLIQRSGEPDFTKYAMSAQIPIYPGDVMRIPERYF
jgi:protein involved in polysaccharide export with SLBB domain